DVHTIADDHGAGDAAGGKLGLPAQALVLGPFRGQVLLGGRAAAARALELRPVRGEQQRHWEKHRRSRAGHGLSFLGSSSGCGVKPSFTGLPSTSCVTGNAPPVASHSRHWKPHIWAQLWSWLFWHTFTSSSFLPAFSVDLAMY